MNINEIIAIIIFGLGYLLITLEHKFHTNKSAIALALAAILWVIAAITVDNQKEITHILELASAEVFSIVVFLLSAMALVEVLTHYHFFDLIREKLESFKLNNRKQFLVIGGLTFFLSAILDNLTITIVMLQIARRFFREQNLLIVACGVVILANAGGAWSPIGDVTTIMIWLAGKFSAMEIILQTFIPSALLGLTAAFLLSKKIDTKAVVSQKGEKVILSKSEKGVIGMSLFSFSLPIMFSRLGLPPYFGLLFGLGLVWLMIDFAKRRSTRSTHLEANIESLLQKTDLASIKFFIGILLSVSALQALGVLHDLSLLIFGQTQEFTRVIIGNTLIGMASSVVDNVPLTALSLEIITLKDTAVWTLLALTVGTGGSFLLIGSVAGVIAGGIVKELTFEKYLKIASIPALVGYFVGVSAWLGQYYLVSLF